MTSIRVGTTAREAPRWPKSCPCQEARPRTRKRACVHPLARGETARVSPEHVANGGGSRSYCRYLCPTPPLAHPTTRALISLITASPTAKNAALLPTKHSLAAYPCLFGGEQGTLSTPRGRASPKDARDHGHAAFESPGAEHPKETVDSPASRPALGSRSRLWTAFQGFGESR